MVTYLYNRYTKKLYTLGFSTEDKKPSMNQTPTIEPDLLGLCGLGFLYG